MRSAGVTVLSSGAGRHVGAIQALTKRTTNEQQHHHNLASNVKLPSPNNHHNAHHHPRKHLEQVEDHVQVWEGVE